MKERAERHEDHPHVHGAACGHTAVVHNDHTDYLHNGHLHHMHGSHVDEHIVDETSKNRSTCTPDHACGGHDANHVHGVGCGHEAVPHAGHTDYLVKGHLHHPHGTHCDNHGSVELAK